MLTVYTVDRPTFTQNRGTKCMNEESLMGSEHFQIFNRIRITMYLITQHTTQPKQQYFA